MFLALLVGTAVLLGSVLLYGIALGMVVMLVVRLIHHGYTGLSLWRNVAIMMAVTSITATAHVIQIVVWAGLFLACGEVPTFETALYFSAQSYTAVGYGDVALSQRWRLLGPLEAINGLLLFGLSTSVMFAVMSRLITNRLHRLFGEEGKHDE